MNDHCAGCGIFRYFIFAEEHIGKKHPKSRSGVRLQHIHDGFSELCRLLGRQRGKNTMINSIVKEQHFGRLDKDRYKRKQTIIYKYIDSCGQYRKNCAHKRADCNVAQHREDHSDNTGRKVIDQHLKPCRHMSLHKLVKFLDTEACQRPHHHGSHEHCNRCITHNCTDHGDSTYYTAPVSADHAAAGRSNQDRNKICKHRTD